MGLLAVLGVLFILEVVITDLLKGKTLREVPPDLPQHPSSPPQIGTRTSLPRPVGGAFDDRHRGPDDQDDHQNDEARA